MTIDYMRTELIKKYGQKMRGKEISKMSDGQILAIYNRMINSKNK